MANRVYITTTLPYVNAEPHVGTVLEFVQADAYARVHRLLGHEVLFNTGTDEHGQKIFEKAKENNEDTQTYVDRYAATFKDLKKALNLSYDHFIRTTDPKHKVAAQEFWKRCEANGDIYKKQYHIKYCVGCELEKTDSELVDSQCPLHPKNEIQLIDEENYFFKLSKYNEPLLRLYKEQQNFVVPQHRLNELISLIEREGLQDFSISRLKEKMAWGVPVPGDETQVMYVWFDALINYVSTIGWPDDMASFEKWWPVVQFAGKDQVRQQAAMWQGMLLSAGLPFSKQIYIHGFINIHGEKISKSVGNVIRPYEVVEKYGTDALRYYYLRHVHPFEDSDFTYERFEELYTANLVNGIGNLTSRVMKLAETYLDSPITRPGSEGLVSEYVEAITSFEFNRAVDYVWKRIQDTDERIAEEEPFKVVKTDVKKGKQMIKELVHELYQIALALEPFMPETSEKIKEAILTNKKPENLFPRLES
jgi:methionyl-tRNA synthetase